MKIFEGFNSAPEGFHAEVIFEEASLLLRIQSRIIYLERYSYPKAISKGLGILWPDIPDSSKPPAYPLGQWKVINRNQTDRERWQRGSLAYLSTTRSSVISIKLRQKIAMNPFLSILGFMHLTRRGLELKLRKQTHKANGTWKEFLNEPIRVPLS